MKKATSSARLYRLALAGIAAVALAAPIGVAHADKVGVAAAVNPDAFSSLSGSPQTQLNIGKSIFFNERINTTTSGLVQVLLVDGSTFTVGPGSDLVIDKFVYNPNKKTGEIVATFTKGAMRFVGGKISKNEGGVTVNTPSGALAIRGGMFMTNGKVFAFLFGEHMTLTGKNGQSLTVFAPGNLIDTTNGEIRQTKPGDIAILMAALTPGGNGGVTPGTTPPPAGNGVKAATLSNIAAEVINEATATQIQDQIQKEIDNLNNTPTEPTDTTTPGEPTTTPTETPPPPNTLALGYAAGTFTKDGGPPWDPPAGTLISASPTDVALQFDGTTKAFSGAVFKLFSNDDGGAKITFVPISLPAGSIPPEIEQVLADSGVFFGAAATSTTNPNSSIVSYGETIPGAHPADPPTSDLHSEGHTIPGNFAGDPPTFNPKSTEIIDSGSATLIGFIGNGSFFCSDCNFMKWGAWFADLSIENGPPTGNSQISAVGWWVAADSLPTIGQLPTLGTASYDGEAIGQVAYYTGESWQNYLARGAVHMDWDFKQRAGLLEISHFRDQGENPVLPELNVAGRMDMPGVATDLNKFSGPLLGTLGDGGCPNVNGMAMGSFAAKGVDKTAGVIGNFSVANTGDSSFYKASGVFGAGRVGAAPNGSLDNLPPFWSTRSIAFGPNLHD